LRSGWVVFALCVAISVGLGVALKMRYKPELSATQDVIAALVYFMEEHGGRFPASEAELRACSFVEAQPDGALRILPRAGTYFSRPPHGIPLADLTPFEIAWGVDLAACRVDERGLLRDANGAEVRLVRWPSSPSSWKVYSLQLYAAQVEIRRLAGERTPE